MVGHEPADRFFSEFSHAGCGTPRCQIPWQQLASSPGSIVKASMNHVCSRFFSEYVNGLQRLLPLRKGLYERSRRPRISSAHCWDRAGSLCFLHETLTYLIKGYLARRRRQIFRSGSGPVSFTNCANLQAPRCSLHPEMQGYRYAQIVCQMMAVTKHGVSCPNATKRPMKLLCTPGIHCSSVL
jgi:hypothetical protein